MRIRQVKPAFWTDKVTGSLSRSARLTYIGLWMMADDAGWIDEFDLDQVAVELYPWDPVRHRERQMAEDVAALTASGRVVWHDCGCMHIPHLEEHQRISGIRSFRSRDAHAKHDPLMAKQVALSDKQKVRTESETLSDKQSPLSHSPGTVGNGRERNVTVGNGTPRPLKEPDDEMLILAARAVLADKRASDDAKEGARTTLLGLGVTL